MSKIKLSFKNYQWVIILIAKMFRDTETFIKSLRLLIYLAMCLMTSFWVWIHSNSENKYFIKIQKANTHKNIFLLYCRKNKTLMIALLEFGE